MYTIQPNDSANTAARDLVLPPLRLPYTLTQHAGSPRGLKYRVRIINPQSKRDYMDLTWHNLNEKFDFVLQLRQKLIESFPEYVPATLSFHTGYLVGRGSQKRWIVRSEDLQKMYECFYDGDEIKLWCDGKCKGYTQGKKRKSEEDISELEPSTKRDSHSEVEKETRTSLEKKHCDKYSGPQYTLWAKFIRMGRHDDYDNPPAIPLMTGQQKGHVKSKKESVSDALAGAASAIANVLTGKSTLPSSPAKSSSQSLHSLSPNNQANLRRKHLGDLRMLSQLLDDGVLTMDEFQEQKSNILSGLKKLTFTT